jgi:hypothetical protein
MARCRWQTTLLRRLVVVLLVVVVVVLLVVVVMMVMAVVVVAVLAVRRRHRTVHGHVGRTNHRCMHRPSYLVECGCRVAHATEG